MHIAVIVPAFNIALFLGDALRSVLGQNHSDWSLIVIDDGSVDDTAQVAVSFDDPRIRLIQQENAGASAARNRGIAAMEQADAVLFLDGDDWLAPDAMEAMVAALDDAPWAAAACGRYARIDVTGAATLSPALPDGCLLTPLLTRNLFVNGGQLLIRREAIKAAGLFHTSLSYGEDWEYWVRLALLGEFTALQRREPVLFARERSDSAYWSHAVNPTAWVQVMAVIHDNPNIPIRVGVGQLTRLRQRAQAEAAWTIGRELVRHGRLKEGWRWLWSSLRQAPSAKRMGLLGLCWLRLAPFNPYPAVVSPTEHTSLACYRQCD